MKENLIIVSNAMLVIYTVSVYLFFVILTPLNIISVPLTVVWLLVIGELNLIAIGFAFAIVGYFLISIMLEFFRLLLSGITLLIPFSFLDSKGPKWYSSRSFLVFSFLISGVIIAWCTITITYFDTYSDNDNYIPLLILIYAISTMPFMYLTRKKSNEDSLISPVSVTANYSTQIGAFVALVCYAMFDFEMEGIIISQILIHLFGIVVNTIVYTFNNALYEMPLPYKPYY